MKTSLTQGYVRDVLVKVFQRHGAVKLSTPLLCPRQKMYEHSEHYTCLMDHSGRLIGLPFDLRVSHLQQKTLFLFCVIVNKKIEMILFVAITCHYSIYLQTC